MAVAAYMLISSSHHPHPHILTRHRIIAKSMGAIFDNQVTFFSPSHPSFGDCSMLDYRPVILNWRAARYATLRSQAHWYITLGAGGRESNSMNPISYMLLWFYSSLCSVQKPYFRDSSGSRWTWGYLERKLFVGELIIACFWTFKQYYSFGGAYPGMCKVF